MERFRVMRWAAGDWRVMERTGAGESMTVEMHKTKRAAYAALRRLRLPVVPWVEVDTETAYGITMRSSRSFRVF